MGNMKYIPSGKYFAWGALNGIILGISIRYGVDISETGILAEIFNAFEPLIKSIINIRIFVVLLGIIGFASLIWEGIKIYNKGPIPITIALLGIFSFISLVIWGKSWSVIPMLIGLLLVYAFPDK